MSQHLFRAAAETPMLPTTPRIVVAIPAHNEEVRLPACLSALGSQQPSFGAGFTPEQVALVVLANNCSDRTAAVARAQAASLPFPLAVQEVALPPGLAHAGGARAVAMEAAVSLLGPSPPSSAALLTTDADGQAQPGWLAANLSALAAGADAVAGAIALDPVEAAGMPPALRDREAQEARYAAQLDEIAALVDPDEDDPWPRHAAHSGASIALTLAAFRRVGGVPPIPVGEDRALFEALRRRGMRVRHCAEARVLVSCRLQGRATGGMADTLQRRLAALDQAPLDPTLEPVVDAFLRLRCRRALRSRRAEPARRGTQWGLALALGLSPRAGAEISAMPEFWRAWEAFQARAWLLRHRRPLRGRDLRRQSALAERLLHLLRAASPNVSPPPAPRAAGRSGTAHAAAAEAGQPRALPTR
jgi:hypothetical protein